MNQSPLTLGQKLTALRRAKGMTQEALAEAIGVTRQTISKWELDTSTPDLSYLTALCDIFSVTADTLIRSDMPLETPEPEPIPEPPEIPPTPPVRIPARTAGWVVFILGCVCLFGGILESFLIGSPTFLILSVFVLVPGIELLTVRRRAGMVALLTVGILCVLSAFGLSVVLSRATVSGIAFIGLLAIALAAFILAGVAGRKK